MNLIKLYFRDAQGVWVFDSQFRAHAPNVLKTLQMLSHRLADESEGFFFPEETYKGSYKTPTADYPPARLEHHYEDGFATFEYDPSVNRWDVDYLGFTRYGEEPYNTYGRIICTNGLQKGYEVPDNHFISDWKGRALAWVRNGYQKHDFN